MLSTCQLQNLCRERERDGAVGFDVSRACSTWRDMYGHFQEESMRFISCGDSVCRSGQL